MLFSELIAVPYLHTMQLDEILSFCLGLKATTEHFPFDQRTLVFKVMGKMYALIDVETPDSINLKCDPERAIELRERYASVQRAIT